MHSTARGAAQKTESRQRAVHSNGCGSRQIAQTLAIDHTHCLGDGHPLTAAGSYIERVQDERIYGLFDEFRRHFNLDSAIASAQQLENATKNLVEPLVMALPPEWAVGADLRAARGSAGCSTSTIARLRRVRPSFGTLRGTRNCWLHYPGDTGPANSSGRVERAVPERPRYGKWGRNGRCAAIRTARAKQPR